MKTWAAKRRFYLHIFGKWCAHSTEHEPETSANYETTMTNMVATLATMERSTESTTTTTTTSDKRDKNNKQNPENANCKRESSAKQKKEHIKKRHKHTPSHPCPCMQYPTPSAVNIICAFSIFFHFSLSLSLSLVCVAFELFQNSRLLWWFRDVELAHAPALCGGVCVSNTSSVPIARPPGRTIPSPTRVF